MVSFHFTINSAYATLNESTVLKNPFFSKYYVNVPLIMS